MHKILFVVIILFGNSVLTHKSDWIITKQVKPQQVPCYKPPIFRDKYIGLFLIYLPRRVPTIIVINLSISTMQSPSKLANPKAQMVTLEMYMQLDAKWKAAEKRARALTHLTQIIADKEYECRLSKEKAANYEVLLKQMRRQFASLVKTNTSYLLKCPKCEYCVNDIGYKSTPVTDPQYGTRQNVLLKFPQGSGNKVDSDTSLSPGEDSVDGCYLGRSGSMSTVGALQADGAAPSLSFETILKNSPPAVGLLKSPTSEASPTTAAPGFIKSPTSVVSPTSPKPSDVKPSVNIHNGLFQKLEVSKKNFDQIALENARLKQALTKLEEDTGVNVEHFMTCLEYERVIALLRDELSQAKYEAEELQHIILLDARKDVSGLTQQLTELQNRNTQFQREIKSKQSIADQYLQAYEKIKEQNSDLQIQLKTQEQQVLELQKQLDCCKLPEQSSTKPTDSTTGHEDFDDVDGGLDNVSLQDQVQQQLSDLKKQLDNEQESYKSKLENLQLQFDDVSLKLTREQQENEHLRNECENLGKSLQSSLEQTRFHPAEYPESVNTLLTEKKSLEDKIKTQNHDLREALESKHLLALQLQTFNEDYTRFQLDFDKRNQIIKEQKEKIASLERDLLSVTADRETRKYLEERVKKLEQENNYLQKFQLGMRSHHLHQSYDEGLGGSLSLNPSHPSRVSMPSGGQSFGSHGRTHHGSFQPISHDSAFGSGSIGFPSTGSSYASAGSKDGMSHYDSGHSSSSSGISSSMASQQLSAASQFVCDRCYEEFKIFEEDKYHEHVKKCVI